jgi:dTMP kinase
MALLAAPALASGDEAANLGGVSQGLFISFEGGEGAGKSTQVRRLAERLAEHSAGAGREVVTTREPGGSPGAEAIRALLVDGEADRWSPLTETLLFYAARSDHLERTIRPALARGAVVISDRFSDSTRAYQAAAGGVAEAFIAALEAAVVGATRPDLTLILDLPAERGLERAASRGGGEARFERKGVAFHRRLREGFLELALAEAGRCVVIDADRPVEAVAEAVDQAVDAVLADRIRG